MSSRHTTQHEVNTVEINIQAAIGTCSQFINEKGQMGELSIVIAPLKVRADQEMGKVVVVNGCNMWEACHNEDCWYSLVARQRKRHGGESEPVPRTV